MKIKTPATSDNIVYTLWSAPLSFGTLLLSVARPNSAFWGALHIRQPLDDILQGRDFKEAISNWKSFKYVRSFIEEVFKIKKNALSLDRLHKYTNRSVKKTCSLGVLLTGILALGFKEKGSLQKLAEW